MMRFALVGGVAALAALGSSARADVGTFYFAQQGQSYSAFMGADNPLVGQEIMVARIYLDVESFAGSDAADFATDISFPISPFPGKTNFLVYSGAELGWSGEGVFHYFLETTDLNGTFVPARYGAESFSDTFHGRVLDGSRIEFVTVPGPGPVAVMGMAGVAVWRRRGR